VATDPKSKPLSDREVNTSGLVDTILQIGKERQRILTLMKTALLRGDDAEALDMARELTGLPRKNATR
jgi:hypothetical protein